MTNQDRSRMARAATEVIGVHAGRARDVVTLRMPEARKIGDAMAVAIIRGTDDMSTGMLATALDELICAYDGGAPIGWRALT